MKKSILFTVLLGFFFSCSSQDGGDSITQPNLIPVAGDLGVHDPVMIKEDNTYYVFSTGGDIERPGGFIPFRISSDLRQWRDIGTVFEQMPQWALDSIPGTRGIWAPDISFFNGRYHLYYSISTFGQNNSAIGLATNTTLNPAFAGYAWEDQGMVIRSTSGVTDWNAIDPNIAIEGDG
nr:family 43 glycosylhydrolase [Calditrichia bacterium]